MFKEIKESWAYDLFKKIGGAMADIGGGAIAGAAAAMVPSSKMNPIQKFCIGVGAYGIGRWVGRNAKQSFQEDMDENVDFLVEMVDPTISAYEELKKKEAETEDEAVEVEE